MDVYKCIDRVVRRRSPVFVPKPTFLKEENEYRKKLIYGKVLSVCSIIQCDSLCPIHLLVTHSLHNHTLVFMHCILEEQCYNTLQMLPYEKTVTMIVCYPTTTICTG